MAIVVQKFGGRLLDSPVKIKRAADYIIATRKSGEEPVVVVSAPGRMTDYFIRLARRVAEQPDEREMDMLLSVGERMAMSLLAMAINSRKSYRAVSFTGSQVGIITDTHHTDASIIEVKGYRIREALQRGEVPIIAGFQGVSTDKEITTLGRGGSDATAVALAAAIGAERCELIKECGGLFSADPQIVDNAVSIPAMNYQTLESITEAGAKVVQTRAAALAKEHGVPLVVKGLDGSSGTLVSDRSLSSCPVAGLTLVDWITLIEQDNLNRGNDNHEGCIAMFTMQSKGYAVISNRSNQADANSMITMVGWSGQLPVTIINNVNEALSQAAITPLAMFGLRGSYAWIIPMECGARALRTLHTLAINKGWIFPADEFNPTIKQPAGEN